MPDKREPKIDPGPPVDIELPEDIADAIESIRRPTRGGYPWEPWQDAVLLKHWGEHFNQTGVRKRDLIDKVLTMHDKPRMSDDTARARYLELLEQQNKT